MSGPVRKPGKPAKKYSQAARLHDVIRILKARYGATVAELAEECGVTRRTVYRDLQALEEAGYPLTREEQPDGTVLHGFISEFKDTLPITFSLQELMTLYFCRGQLAFLRGTPFQDDLDAIFARIRSALPARSVAHLERLAEAAVPRFQGLRDYSGKREILESLRDALLRQYRCKILYAPPRREAEEYLFDPYTLLFFKDSLYLGGFAHNRGALRLFLVDRLQRVEPGAERFEVPEDFRVEDLTGSAFGLIDDAPMAVRVRFAPEVAHLIRERTWHPDQLLAVEKGCSVVLSFDAGGEKEILSWLYSYIPHVEVLSPPELKRTFA
ncbi:MAG: transcriptional regulator [Desulfuromonas sp.]|nr:transcriptional regulator [Desulfuromonas sp.]PLX86012.1 MAG: transcriptional regulator [Desulfuromonas sp.]